MKNKTKIIIITRRILNLFILFFALRCFFMVQLDSCPDYQYIFSNLHYNAFIWAFQTIMFSVLPILSYFKKIRILTIILAIVLIVVLAINWPTAYSGGSISYFVFGASVIIFNLVFALLEYWKKY